MSDQTSTATTAAADLQRFDWLEALRGVAVLGVVAVHAALNSQTWGAAEEIGRLGQRGVQLFYVLSAFTIFLSIDERAAKGDRSLLYFYIRRIFRIAPLFYIAILCNIAYELAIGGGVLPPALSPGNILLGVLFLHGFSPVAINAVAIGGWSIAVEFMFYALAPFLHRLRAGLFPTILLYGLIAAACGFGSWWISDGITDQLHEDYYRFLWFPVEFPVFLLGILTYRVWQSHGAAVKPAQRKPLSIALLLLSLALIWLSMPTRNETLYLSSLAFGPLALALALHPWKALVNPLLRFIGRLSFSIYLMHFFCLLVVTALFVHLESRGVHLLRTRPGFLIYYLMTLALAVPLSAFTHRFVEKPGIRLGHRLIYRLAQKG